MKKKIQFIGLNGTMKLPPENTLESIQKTLELGAKSIEVNVHVCDSGEPVVIKDSDVDETTNGMGEVEDFTLEELKKLRIQDQYQIPSLKEVLDLIDGQAKVIIELSGFGTSKAVSAIIKEYAKKENWKRKMFLVTSFNWFELVDFYSIDQKTRIGVLTKKLTKDTVSLAKTVAAFSIHPKNGKLKQKLLEKAIKKGFKIRPWEADIPVFEAETLEEIEVKPIQESAPVEEVLISPIPEVAVS